jgi:hypothetical protein
MSTQTAAPQAAQPASSSPSPETQSQVAQQGEQSLDSSSDSPEGISQDTVDALQDQAQNGTPKEKAEAKKMLKSLKLKVDGREYEEELPFEIPDDENAKNWMIKQLQLGKMGTKRAQEYGELEKEVRGFVERLRKDPLAALQDPLIGVDVKKLAASVIEREIEDSQKTPEQLELEKIQRELEKERNERKKEKEEREARERQLLEEQEFERIDREMINALESSGLATDESSAAIVKRMAEYMMLGLSQGLDVRPQDVLPVVREEFENDIRSYLGKLPSEQLEKFISKEAFNQLRKKNIAKVKAPTPPNKLTDTGMKPKEEQKDDKKQSFRSFFGV